MSPDRIRRLASILEVASELTVELRGQYLKTLGQQDSQLAQALDRLFAGEATENGIPQGDLHGEDPEPSQPTLSALKAAVEAGKIGRLGPYRILDRLGAGGMGDVFLAERADEEFERQVAIKVIREGIGSVEILERFLAERQILATFDHPNIAKLFEGGTTEDGRPYLVMERIEGTHIDRYCNENRLTIRQRLELFLQVCDAVDYAHGQLVVHRDLKPSNVLVTHDGTVKLLDFGVAKLLSKDIYAPSQDLTVTGANPLTPNYASPEQLRGERVTTRSDVYSLGALLFKLLTGKAPIDLSGEGPQTWAQKVETTKAPTPSECFALRLDSEGARQQEITESFRASGEQIQRLLRGDVDTIVLTALHKDLNRRYGSPDLLGKDIRNHLAGRPVSARADSAVYVFGKFVQRHRLSLGLLALTLTAFAALALFAFDQARDARSERDLARQAQQEAEEARDVEGEISNFLFSVFQNANPKSPLASSLTARELLLRHAQLPRPILEENPLAKARFDNALGQALYALGSYEEASTLLTSSLATRRAELGPEHSETVRNLANLGQVRLFQEGRLGEAETMLRRAIALAEGESSRSQAKQRRRALASWRYSLAGALHRQGKVSESLGPIELSVAEARREDSVVGPAHAAEYLSLLGATLNILGRPGEAVDIFEESLELGRRHFEGENSQSAITQINFAGALGRVGRFEEAASAVEKALDFHERHGSLRDRSLHIAIFTRANIALTQGDFDIAIDYFSRAITVAEEAQPPRLQDAANARNGLGVVFLNLKDLDRARRELEASLTLLETLPERNLQTEGDLWNNLGIVHFEQGNLPEGRRCYQKSIDLVKQTAGPETDLLASRMVNLGTLEVQAGQLDVAETLYIQALGIYDKIEPKPMPAGDAYTRYAALLARLDRPGQAEELYQKALALREERLRPDHPDLVLTLSSYASFLRDLGREDEAASLESRIPE